VLGEVLARHDDDWTCPIREGELKKPRLSSNRGLILRNGGLLQVATTDSADFRGPELRRIRDEMGQVYLDVSEKLLLDDFATDLARLAPDPVCDGCHLLPGCPGMFAPAQDASSCFDAAERELIEVLRTVSGRVLDVGMGEPRSLLPLLVVDEPEDEEDEDDVEPQEPHLPFDYVGIEPFAPRAYQLSETFPFATVVTAAAEDPRLAKLVEAEERPFDHVLLLRSYNHLRDLHAAFENLLRLLKPGGGLVLVENTAFGLVRSDRKTRALSKLEAKGEAKFEHYRNHSSHEALEVLRPFGLELVAHYPVEAGKANQWLIWMRKPS